MCSGNGTLLDTEIQSVLVCPQLETVFCNFSFMRFVLMVKDFHCFCKLQLYILLA